MGAVLFSMKMTGASEFKRALELSEEKLKDKATLFQAIIAYFEGKLMKFGRKTLTQPSPIEKIFETQGAVIESNWTRSEQTWKDKERNWKKQRKYDLPSKFNKPLWQVHTGLQLKSLLDSGVTGAVREIGESLKYGTSVEYSGRNQALVKILDFYPAMEAGITKIMNAWIMDVPLEIKE